MIANELSERRWQALTEQADEHCVEIGLLLVEIRGTKRRPFGIGVKNIDQLQQFLAFIEPPPRTQGERQLIRDGGLSNDGNEFAKRLNFRINTVVAKNKRILSERMIAVEVLSIVADRPASPVDRIQFSLDLA